MSAPPKASQLQHAPERSCVGKVRMGRKRAHRAARVLRYRGDPVHAYPCQHCCSWHVGHDMERS